MQISHWAGLFAPAGTPAPIVERMNAALKMPEVRGKLTANAVEPIGGSVVELETFMKTERQRLSDLAANMKVSKGN